MQVPARKLSVRETLKVAEVTVSSRLQAPGSGSELPLPLGLSLPWGPGRRARWEKQGPHPSPI